MNKIWKWLNESNRLYHLIGGAIWGLAFSFMCIAVKCTMTNSFWLSVLSVSGIGAAMEYKDYQHGCEPDVVDLIMTIVGGLIGAGIAIVIFILVR